MPEPKGDGQEPGAAGSKAARLSWREDDRKRRRSPGPGGTWPPDPATLPAVLPLETDGEAGKA
jgi:hypothetical protein